MKYKSVFDIIGPVMVGPSSSHTAGAARIGRIARKLFGRQPKKRRSRFTVPLPKRIKGMAPMSRQSRAFLILIRLICG